tara:strand:- start:161 stop:313 length:153 start_codon:yes stop_codon:yes gene_type:complete
VTLTKGKQEMIRTRKKEWIEIGYIIGAVIIGFTLISSMYVYSWILIYQEA